MKKLLLCLSLLTLCWSADPVRMITVLDQNNQRLDPAQWSNKIKTVTVRWQEPVQEIFEYRYILANNGKEIKNNTVKEPLLILNLIDNGEYILKIIAIGKDGSKSEPRSITLRYDTTAPEVEVTGSVTVTTSELINYSLSAKAKKDNAAPYQQLLYYWGDSPEGTPDTVADEIVSLAQPLPGKIYFLRVSAEDAAYNITTPQTLYSCTGEERKLSSSEIKIVERISDNKGEGVAPGTKLKFGIVVQVVGTEDMQNIVVADSVPEGTTLITANTQDNQAIIEYWDTRLNNGLGAWTKVLSAENVSKVRWIYASIAAGKKVTMMYTVIANKI